MGPEKPARPLSDELAAVIAVTALLSMPATVTWYWAFSSEPSSIPPLLATLATSALIFGVSYLFRRELAAIDRRFRRHR